MSEELVEHDDIGLLRALPHLLAAQRAAGDLRTAIEEALASLECGMVAGAVLTLQDALSRKLPAETGDSQ